MKEKIHPNWYPEAKLTCISCGTVWTVGSTMPESRVDICSNCHPFYTGEQRIVDTEGQVDRFLKRLQQRDRYAASVQQREEEKVSLETSIDVLELSDRYTEILRTNGFTDIGQVAEALMKDGDDALLRYQGIGRKVLADIKKKLRALEIPFEATAAE